MGVHQPWRKALKKQYEWLVVQSVWATERQGVAKGGKPGSSTRKPMQVYNNCVSVMYREIPRMRAMSPRRSHRACHRRRLPHQIRLSCLNVQSMNWTVDLYRNMLYGIVERMRKESTECMFLSELGTPNWIQTKKGVIGVR